MPKDAEIRLNAPASDVELERRWTAVRRAMEDAGIDVLLMQGNNDFMGGYIKWFTDLPATQGYSVIVTFPRDAGMTVIKQGPFGLDRTLTGSSDAAYRGVDRLLTCPSYASAGYSHAYESELAAKALAPYVKGVVGLVGLSTLSHHLMSALEAGPLAGARIVDASDLVDRIKAIKSAEEIGRTAVLGRATDEMHEEFAFVLKARRFMLDQLTPGAECAEVWNAYNAFMRDNGKPEESRLHCHSMGYDMVERPLVRFDEPMRLAAGMVVSCHPTYETAGGLHWICDNFLIGDDGTERLHRYPETIVEIG